MVATIYPLLGPHGSLMSALRLTRCTSPVCCAYCVLRDALVQRRVHVMADILKYTLSVATRLKSNRC